MDKKIFKRIRRFKAVFAILMGLDLVIFIGFGIMRYIDNLWPNQEIWVDAANKKAVMSQVEGWQFPTEEITRVVKQPGLGDMAFTVYYKDGSIETTGWLSDAKVSNETDQLFREHGENEGSRNAGKIYLALGVVFFLALLGEVITFKAEDSVDNSLMEEDSTLS